MFRQNHRRDRRKKEAKRAAKKEAKAAERQAKIEAAAQQKLQERERMEQAAAERLTKTPVETHQPMVEEPAAPTPVQIDFVSTAKSGDACTSNRSNKNRNESKKKRRQMKLVFSNLKFLKKRKTVIINYHQLIC